MANKKAEEGFEVNFAPETAREQSPSNAAVMTAEGRRKQLVKKYMKEPKVPVNISPLYKPHFGKTMTVSINGITVVVPCNGKVYNIPESFANEVNGRIMKVNAIADKQDRMKNIKGNFETSPGDLKFF